MLPKDFLSIVAKFCTELLRYNQVWFWLCQACLVQIQLWCPCRPFFLVIKVMHGERGWHTKTAWTKISILEGLHKLLICKLSGYCQGCTKWGALGAPLPGNFKDN